jgi:exopolysaccharide biosynthesis polyprenyl glycosylphosphotransferase
VRRSGRLLESTVIVGAGKVGVELAGLLQMHREYGLAPVGFLDDCTDGVDELPLPVLGSVKQLDIVLTDFDVERVVVAFGRTGETDWISALRTAVLNDVEVHVIPRFFDFGFAPSGLFTDEIWGIPLYRVRRSALRTPAWQVKRAVDVVLSAILLVALAPLLVTLATAVALSSKGPILFRQTRVGQHGRPFQLLKFRSMRIGHDGERSWRASENEQTTVGRWLRRTSLDELPQLWNVLRGDMSLVGPRPERPHFVEQFSSSIPGYTDRHRLQVGMTGWAQVHGLRGDNTSIHERARFDNFYVECWSLWLDLATLLRTVGTVVRDFVSQLGRRP